MPDLANDNDRSAVSIHIIKEVVIEEEIEEVEGEAAEGEAPEGEAPEEVEEPKEGDAD